MLKQLTTILFAIIYCCSISYSQTKIDFSKYRINLLSKSTKFNCTSKRVTIPIDLNNDGLIDFVTTGDDMGPCGTNGEISYLKFFENDGKDNYIENNSKYSKDSLWVIRPDWYLVEDFNGDGKKDIFITGEHIHQQWNNSFLNVYRFIKPNIDIDTSNNYSFVQRRHHLYLSQSDGTFKDSPEFLQGMRLGSTFGITAIDYNKDGYMDLINAVQQFSNNDNLYPSGWDIEIFINNGGKSMTRSTPFTVRGALDINNNKFNKSRIDSLGGNSEGPENLKFHDVNNDGYLDMIFNDRSGNAFCMLSQNKLLDLYSPIIKFDDFQTNGLLTNMPGSTVEIRGFYITDIKKDGTKQLIEYWANGGGDYQPGKKLYQLIKIFDIKNGGFTDATNAYFKNGENIGKNYGAGLLSLVDVDQDGYIDLFPRVIDHDGKANQGYGSDSTMYYRNENGKFILTSLGLKYYFKEFKELADSMKVYKYDTLHPFSIANSLTPINTGKSNKIIFYSFGTEPGIDKGELNQYTNKYFFNKENQVYNDSLNTYFKGFILSPVNCNVQKPTFNTKNLDFCYGDSLKLSITNVNSGDSLKWYYSTRRDFSNVTSKYFYDSTKLFVIKTDSNGCSISSDTIFISVKEQPKLRILGNQSLAFNKDTTRLFVQHESTPISGKWYYNNSYFSDKDSVILKNIGEYKYVQIDSNGCMYSEKFTLKKDDQIGVRLKKYYFDIKENIAGGAGVNNSPGVIVYNVDSIEHIIHTLATSTTAGAAPLHFFKRNGEWKYEGLYKEGTMSGGARNFSLINNKGEIAIASTGTEAIHPWPLGDIFSVKTMGEKLLWKRLNIDKSFYHSVATGDMNNDGLSDIVGLHMGTYGNWWQDGDLHTYLLNKDSSFSEARSIINFTNILDNYQQSYGSAVLIDDIDKDNTNELIKATYNDSYDGKGTRYGMLFFKFDPSEKKIKYYNQTDQLGIFRDGYKGATSLKTVDIDNDGDKDIVVVIEGPPGGGVQIWLNDGKGNFSPDQIIYTYTDEYGFREFELADINKDGFVDLILHPSGSGNKFRINPRPHNPQTNPWGYLGDGFMLQSSVFLNNKGRFTQLNADISLPGLHPDFMKGYYMNNKLKFIGFEEKTDNNNPNGTDYNLSDFYLYEVELTFCKNLIKPIFNTSKYSFCSNDSLKLNITNRNLGDTLSWYYGTNVDTSSSKIFKETTNLYVIRTDSLGCKISSDTISIIKNALPVMPIVKDTTFCQYTTSSNLSATNSTGSSLAWYGNNASGGTSSFTNSSALTSDTATKSYYVSQINNTTSCESPRAKITVKINPAPASPIVRDTAYCNNTSADTLKAVSLIGHNLSWYGTNSIGGTASNLGSKPNTSSVGNFSYYVSQINNATNCESPRAKIGVTINPLPIAPNVRDTAYCNNASADTLRVTPSSGSSLLWYGTNATGGTSSTTAVKPSTATVGTANYYLSQIITTTGCEGPRSKITVTTKPIPTAPILTRDTANYLLSGASGTTWYKDGVALTDTTQKYKPTTPGSYTAKTTTNGCTSVLSAAYYYLVTDIINLSKDEYIKIAPNPFINQLNFDFIVKGYQRLNIEVFDIATGNKVASQSNLTAGSKITLGQLSAGTYIIRVTSNDQKIVQQFKVMKM